MDYRVAKPSGSGCQSCGQVPGSADDDACLRLTRYHRYHDIGYPSSFGPGVFLAYDASLQLSANAGGVVTNVEWFTPQESRAYDFVTGSATGSYVNAAEGVVKSLELFDATNALTADISTAARAVITRWDGAHDDFAIIALGSELARSGRLTATVDRAGNTTSVAYAYAPNASDAALNWDRTKLWQVSTITDCHGQSAALTYAWHDGQWVVTKIRCPDGKDVTYSYSSNFLAGLEGVTYANGDQATFNTWYDAGTQAQVVEMFDPAAGGSHRRKSLFLTPTSTDNGPLIANRIHLLKDGAGDITYLVWGEKLTATDADGADTYSYVFEGGGSYTGSEPRGALIRVGTANGMPVSSKRAASWDYYQPTSTYTWEDVEKTEVGALKRITSQAIPNGTATPLTNSTTRAAVSGAITGVTYKVGDTVVAQISRTINDRLQPLTETDVLGKQVVNTYDTTGNLLTEVVAYGTTDAATRAWTYDGHGRVLSATDPRGTVTNYDYDAQGHLIKRTEPPDFVNGPRAEYSWTYNSAGRLVTAVSPSSVVGQTNTTRFDYDDLGRLVLTTYADSSTAGVTYGTGVNAGLVVAEVDRVGVVTSYGYDLDGRRTSITRDGDTDVITYIPGTSLEATRTGHGRVVTYAYDHRLRRTSTATQVAPGKTLTETIAYDDADRVSIITDAYGRRTLPIYDTLNREVAVVRELVPGAAGNPAQRGTLTRDASANPGYVIEGTEYDAGGQVLARVDGRGIRTEYQYDHQGRQTQVTEAAGTARAATTYQFYDSVGNLLVTQSPAGRITQSIYNGRNQVAVRTEAWGTPEAGSTTTAYTLTGKVVTVTDPNGHTRTYEYGGCCDYLRKIYDPYNTPTEFGRDALGRELWVKSALNQVTGRAYDGHGRVVSTYDALGAETVITYDDNLGDNLGLDAVLKEMPWYTALAIGPFGSAQRVKDPSNAITYVIRDGAGREICRVDPAGKATTTAYDTVVGGLLQVAVTDPLNRTVRTRSDGAGRVRSHIDAGDNAVLIAYDAVGNQVRVRDATSVGQDAVFDERNRRTSVQSTGGRSTSWTYDADGLRLTEKDGLNKVTTTIYDARGRAKTTSDRINAVTTFSYDQVGNLLSILDAEGGLTEYAYDANNRLQTEVFPTGQQGRTTRTYTYDLGGRLTQRLVTASGFSETTGYGYDMANRLTTRTGPQGADGFTYDKMGRLLTASASSSGVVVTRAYSPVGRLSSESITYAEPLRVSGGALAPATEQVAYAYDDAGQLLTLTDTDGKIIRRGYNTRGLLSSVELSLSGGATFTSLVSREYDQAGRLGSSTYGNVKVETRGYLAGEPLVETIVTPGSSATSSVANLTYTYDGNRRKTSEFDAVTPLSNQEFVYDDADRLTGWNRPVSSASQSWTLSAVGDWQTTTRNSVTESRTHSAVHEVTSRTEGGISRPMSYDGKGNLLDDGNGRTYRWDGENRLQRALIQGYVSTSFLGAGATYVYDALGRRVAKTVNGRTTRYVLAGAQVLLERDGIPEAPASQRAGGAHADGDIAALNDNPVYGGILRAATAGAVKRINFQPDGVQIPIGFIKDAGRSQGVRTNGLTYGWSAAVEDRAQDREGAAELAELDTCVRLQPGPASAATWAIALADGTYPVAIVCGDPSSLDQTNDLVVNGQHLVDPDARDGSFGYLKGDFDGFLLEVEVKDGYLHIATDTEAFDPKICFIEIGPKGAVIDQAARDRMDQFIQRSSDATSDPANRFAGRRIFAYGSYVDEVLAYSADVGGLVSTYYVHNNHLYSPTAITNAAGMVQERYRYDAYGKQTIMAGEGDVRVLSNIGFDRGFTGYVADIETGLCYARARMYSAEMGRFASRDPLGYVDGYSEYAAYFAPRGLDPTGTEDQEIGPWTINTEAGKNRDSGLPYMTWQYDQCKDPNRKGKKPCSNIKTVQYKQFYVVDASGGVHRMKMSGEYFSQYIIYERGWLWGTTVSQPKVFGVVSDGTGVLDYPTDGDGEFNHGTWGDGPNDKMNSQASLDNWISNFGGVENGDFAAAEKMLAAGGHVVKQFRTCKVCADTSEPISSRVMSCFNWFKTGVGGIQLGYPNFKNPPKPLDPSKWKTVDPDQEPRIHIRRPPPWAR